MPDWVNISELISLPHSVRGDQIGHIRLFDNPHHREYGEREPSLVTLFSAFLKSVRLPGLDTHTLRQRQQFPGDKADLLRAESLQSEAGIVLSNPGQAHVISD